MLLGAAGKAAYSDEVCSYCRRLSGSELHLKRHVNNLLPQLELSVEPNRP